ncbi:DM13 domain-containing protein [Photobacterium proteolyticum]|uniref:DM13 domain-containing protein n=1 Tax=Photobacterium proteolyticum TaxID=1903952 RepID=UPI001C37AA3E|nr:DM13 domain-containing protein [Photobacterium proteolyticum]
MKAIGLLLSHLAMLAVGFAAGIYALPILIAPDSPSSGEVQQAAQSAQFSGEFRRDLADSDFLHWGEGRVSISSDVISFQGELAPGPDYKLYLSPQFVETEADFNRLKSSMVKVGEVKTFSSFMVPLDSSIDPAQYTTVIVWCETFGEFITAAQYQ